MAKNIRHKWKFFYHQTVEVLYGTDRVDTRTMRVFGCSQCSTIIMLTEMESKQDLAKKARAFGKENCGLESVKETIDS